MNDQIKEAILSMLEVDEGKRLDLKGALEKIKSSKIVKSKAEIEADQKKNNYTSVQKRRFGVSHGTEHLLCPVKDGSAHALKSRGALVAGAPLRAKLGAGVLELRLQAFLDHERREVIIPRVVLRGHAQEVISRKPEPCVTLAGFAFMRGVFFSRQNSPPSFDGRTNNTDELKGFAIAKTSTTTSVQIT